MHLHYKTKISAKKALSKNGKVIGNNMMVGVRQCIDQAVMNGNCSTDRLEDKCRTLYSVQGGVIPQTLGSLYEPSSTPGTPSKQLGTPIRSLTKAYQAKPFGEVRVLFQCFIHCSFVIRRIHLQLLCSECSIRGYMFAAYITA